MISHFRFRATAARAGPRPRAPSAPAGGAPRTANDPPAAEEEPLAALLRSLRGRQVTLQVGSRLVTGKLITADPITLVGPAGEVTMVAPGAVQAVQF